MQRPSEASIRVIYPTGDYHVRISKLVQSYQDRDCENTKQSRYGTHDLKSCETERIDFKSPS